MSRRKGAVAESVTGLFVLAVLATLVYFTVVISGVDLISGRRKVCADVVFEKVGGLKDHDSVMYRGTKVGSVESISLSPSNLVVRLEIDDSVVLREGYSIRVCSLSLLGGNYLEIEEGTGAPLDFATTLFRGETPVDWMRDVASIARNLSEITSGSGLKNVLANLEAASSEAKAMLERLNRGEGAIGKLLSGDDGLYDDARTTLANAAAASADFRAAVSNASEIAARINAGKGTVGRLVSSDDALYEDLRSAVASCRKAFDSLDFGTASTNVQHVAEGAAKLVDSLNAVAQRMYDEMDFAQQGRRKRYYTDTGEDALLLWNRKMLETVEKNACLGETYLLQSETFKGENEY